MNKIFSHICKSLPFGEVWWGLIFLLCACSRPSVPQQSTLADHKPLIIPDYTDVTIPANLCPTNFSVREACNQVVALLEAGGKSYTYGEGQTVKIDADEWEELKNAAKGKGGIKVTVYGEKGGKWTQYQAFTISVAEEDIDPYISYRLIQPSYVAYEDLSIAQRNLTNFDETEIYNNMLLSTESDGQCINCHSYKNYRTDNMLFHMRQNYGGTMLVHDGTISKIDMKTDSTISAGVYPSWHPTKNLIAFSTNNTGQSFHTKDVAKIEVQDTYSDLILYDVENNTIRNISNDTTELEVFPTWAPDGKTIYYCSAHFEYRDTIERSAEMISRYKEVHYNIYRRSFNPETLEFGEQELIYDAAANEQSATLPRISPDGRYMVFSLGNWGCFHVWHPEADICILDLKTMQTRKLDALNSNRSESYPSFSSNGRWIMTASRRDDGNYTRPYISYFDKQGKCHKAFELPQQDPYFYTFFMRSYNRPEFMVEPVSLKPQDFADVAKGEAKKSTFVSKK